MKKLIVMAVLAAMGLQAQAQIVSSRSSMVTREVIDRGGWSTFGVEYLPSTFSYDGDHDSETYNAFALNYTQAISIASSIPLFIEWGIGAQYSFWDNDHKSYDYSWHFVSAKIPINVIYDISFPNSTIHLDPFVGVKFRGNIWGQIKEDYSGKSETYDLFDKNEGNCNRFQVGLQAGMKVRLNKFFLGIGYGIDFSEFCEKTKINELKLMAGFVF